MKKWIITFSIINCVAIVLVIVSIFLNISACNNSLTANKIYTDCINNVVEIKAVSDNVGESYGTAEIIKKDGTLITNAHVVTYKTLGTVTEFNEYYIRFSFEDEYRQAEIVKYDTDKDIAVLKADLSAVNICPIKIGSAYSLSSGDKIFAVGNASNYGIGIFEGIISIPLLHIELDGVVRSVIQCDLTIAAGNSGGALLNSSGELIGLTTFRTKDNSGNVIYGIVYSIPINIVLEYVNN